MFDLYVPSERYEQELNKLKQQQAQLDDNKDMVCLALCWVHFTSLVIFFCFKFPWAGHIHGTKYIKNDAVLQKYREFDGSGNVALMSRTMAMHVRYNSWCISLPSSAKQPSEMIKFYVVWRTRSTKLFKLDAYLRSLGLWVGEKDCFCCTYFGKDFLYLWVYLVTVFISVCC